MIFRVAPSLCSAFKGVLPSDLLMKYSSEDGVHRMMLDLAVAAEIQDQISEVSSNSSGKKKNKDPKGMAARMKQRREQRLKENEGI